MEKRPSRENRFKEKNFSNPQRNKPNLNVESLEKNPSKSIKIKKVNGVQRN